MRNPRLITPWLCLGIVVVTFQSNLFGQIPFKLKNTHPRYVTFQFFSDSQSIWDDKSVGIPSNQERQVTLNTDSTHTIVFSTDNGYREQLDSVDLEGWVKENPDAVLELKQLYVSEVRTKTVNVQKMRTEERTRQVPVTRYVSQTKTRMVKVKDPKTGKTKMVPQQYTVRVPVTEMRTETFQVQVPYTEQVQQNYTVQVPRTNVALVGRAKTKFLTTKKRELRDKRRRMLGVGLGNGPGGALITEVTPGAPATKVRLFPVTDQNRNKTYSLKVNGGYIVSVNGRQTRNVQEVVDAIQSSPPIMDFTVRDINTGVDHRFQTTLEIK